MVENKKIRESRLVAIKAHGNQDYDGIFPYEKHLEDVIDVLRFFNFDNELYIVSGYLHDTIEDGALSYNKIKEHFGVDVAEIVYCVTDEMGRNREERKSKTYPKIKANTDALIIKLADRIANINHGGKVGMYKKEYQKFKEQLYNGDEKCEKMWDYLDNMLK